MVGWAVQDKRERLPLAERTLVRLKQLVHSGVLQPGDRLPAEPELAARLGVSRPTLRAAIAQLVTEMVLERRRGVGTFVRPHAPRFSHGLERLLGTGESVEQLGMRAGAVNLLVEHVEPDADLEARLECRLEGALLHISRTRTADGQRVLHCEEWVPLNVLPTTRALDDFSDSDSLYDRLRDAGLEIATAMSKIIPLAADPFVSATFDLARGTPVVLLRQWHYGRGSRDRWVLYSENIYNSTAVELHAVRRREL